jgi:pullulanase
MTDAAMIREHLTFLPTGNEQVIAYQLGPHANGDPWTNIIVVLNGSDQSMTVEVPPAKYTLIADGKRVNLRGLQEFSTGRVFVAPYSASILYTETISATE